MLQGFKEFIMRGNVVDLAVGVVIGAAFGSVVTSLVEHVITPIISALAKSPDFGNLSVSVNGTAIGYGAFLNALISFLLIALAIYFFVVVPMNKLMKRFSRNTLPTTRACQECLSEIPVEARRCRHCGQPIVA